MTIEDLKLTIRDVPDFPSRGIMFRDLTTLIKNGEALHLLSDALVAGNPANPPRSQSRSRMPKSMASI